MRTLATFIVFILIKTSAMAFEIKTEIVINASPEKVWEILNNFDNYPSWNPFIVSIEGEVKVGNKITTTIQPPKENEMTFTPKILRYSTNKELTWMGALGTSFIFGGKHKFILIDNEDGTTTFQHSERFSGLLALILKKKLNKNTKAGFISMNEKLKEEVELL